MIDCHDSAGDSHILWFRQSSKRRLSPEDDDKDKVARRDGGSAAACGEERRGHWNSESPLRSFDPRKNHPTNSCTTRQFWKPKLVWKMILRGS
jgi:hypothetical protein